MERTRTLQSLKYKKMFTKLFIFNTLEEQLFLFHIKSVSRSPYEYYIVYKISKM